MTGPALIEQLLFLERRVGGAEEQGIRARWEFGHLLLQEREGKRLPNGRLTEVAEATGCGRWEISRRVTFAERYPTERELLDVSKSFGSWHAICRDALKADRLEQAAEVEPVAPEAGKFGVIVADPPWQYGNKATRGAAEDHYPTMTIEDLCAIPGVESWAADNAHLYLWTTNGFLREAFKVVEAWGFAYKTCLTWVKPQIGLGNYFRNNTEHVLFGVRGNLRTLARDVPTAFEARRGRHSAKPGMFYDLVERSSPGPYLEMFARSQRLGWDTWGNEALDHMEAAS